MKVFSGILSLIMLVSSTGLPLNFHFCKGEIQHVSIFSRKSCHKDIKKSPFACCLKKKQCGDGMDKKCCSDQTEWMQSTHPTITTIHATNFADNFCWIEQSVDMCNQELPVIEKSTILPDIHAPPDIPLFIRYMSLTFYG